MMFNDFVLECLHHNSKFVMGGHVFYKRDWIECGIISIGHLLDVDGYLSYNAFKTKFPDAPENFVTYSGVIRMVKKYQKKLNLDFVNDFIVEDQKIWKYVSSCSVKSVYELFVRTTDAPKCIVKWQNIPNTEIDDKRFLERLSKPLVIQALDGFSISCYTGYFHVLVCFLYRKLLTHHFVLFVDTLKKPFSGSVPKCKTTG